MPVEVRQLLKATCEGPHCAEHHKEAVVLEWDDSQPETVPDAVYRLVTIVTVTQQKFVFCSANCAIDWLDSVYQPFVFPCDCKACNKHDHGDVVPLQYIGVNGERKSFCSASALRTWLKTEYVPPMSPKEKSEKEAGNAESKVVSIAEAK